MSQSQKLVATCPTCENEMIYKGKAKRPRITCKKCKTRFYIDVPNDQKTDQKDSEKTDSIEKKFTSLDEATIEKLIVNLLNDEVTEPRIKLAVDFHNKVKGTDASTLEEPLDMEGFLNYEVEMRKE